MNNPQLSDLQLQVDSGEVFFAHSFMLYARCPLLAEMVKMICVTCRTHRSNGRSRTASLCRNLVSQLTLEYTM